MTGFIINPGTEVIGERVTLKQAIFNMRRFRRDVERASGPATWGRDNPKWDEDGWYSFWLESNGRRLSVMMPGLPLRRVRRWGGLPFPPRLYVDGNSWWWSFAVGMWRDDDGEG